MDMDLFFLLASFAIILFIVGFAKKQLLIITFSGISFILLGLFSFNGLSYVSSSIITDINSTVTEVNYVYSNWHHAFGNSDLTVGTTLGILFCLFGLFLFLVSAILFFQGKSEFNLNTTDDDIEE